MNRFLILTLAFAGLTALADSDCHSEKIENKNNPSFSNRVREEVVAVKAVNPIILDGKLNEADWENAPAYTLVHALRQYSDADWDIQEFFRNGVVESGKVKVLWDDKYLYVGIDFIDRDLYAEVKEDQQHHYKTGDVAEIFLKPLNKRWYWELYVTPLGNKTAFFFPGRGTVGLPSVFPDKSPLKGLKASAFSCGTVNDPSDQDVKWTAEMAIPRAEVGREIELSPDVPWLIFFARYNYGKDLELQENSGFPLQPTVNFHNHAGYAILKMAEKAK